MENFLGNKIATIKIATLIVGVINVGFISHSYLPFGAEEAYLSAVIICFIISFLWTMAIIVGLINEENEMWRKCSMLFHMVASVFYLATLIAYFVSLVDKGNKYRFLWERIIAFILGIANTILYGFAGYMYYKSV